MGKYTLDLYKQIIEGFEDSMDRIATPEIGDAEDFVKTLEKKLADEIAYNKKHYGVWALSHIVGNKVNPTKNLLFKHLSSI